jgi:hypothetical protein
MAFHVFQRAADTFAPKCSIFAADQTGIGLLAISQSSQRGCSLVASLSLQSENFASILLKLQSTVSVAACGWQVGACVFTLASLEAPLLD